MGKSCRRRYSQYPNWGGHLAEAISKRKARKTSQSAFPIISTSLLSVSCRKCCEVLLAGISVVGGGSSHVRLRITTRHHAFARRGRYDTISAAIMENLWNCFCSVDVV